MKTLAALLITLALPLAALAGEPGYAIRDLELRAEPRNEAPVIAKLARNGRYELLQRKQVWAQISANGREGWVLFFYLAVGEAPKPGAGRELGGALGLATGRPQGDITAVIGARGLTEEQLKAARFDAEELARLEALRVSRDTAQAWAREGALSPQQVEALAAPASTAGDSAAPNDTPPGSAAGG